MFKKYCKDCGCIVEVEYGQTEYTCTVCKRTGKINDLVPQWTLDARMEQLKAMHTIMMNANDENLYMRWIYLMPDCPSKEDFFDIALDKEQYNECFDLFLKLAKHEDMRW